MKLCSARLELSSDKVADIYAVCVNCNKRFTSIRAISMHLKVAAARHAVTFSNHGVYDKKTGLRTSNCANYYNSGIPERLNRVDEISKPV
jgi:hypothetical protein